MICLTVGCFRRTAIIALIAGFAFLHPAATSMAQVPVRHTQGVLHGFLVPRTLAGESLADDDLIQVARGNRVTGQLVFKFKDGSIHDETAVISQHGNFRLLRYHLVQKGSTFQHPIEVSIDGSTGQVTVRSTDEDGKKKVLTERLDLPRDLANGLVLTPLMNIQSQAPEMMLSMMAAIPKPRLVKLAIIRQGEDPFALGGSPFRRGICPYNFNRRSKNER